MFSKRVLATARTRVFFASHRSSPLSKPWSVVGAHLLRAQLHSSHLLQADTVKVPQMAESISEGTLRSWTKKVGDTVEADEEVATIETDKIDVTVNAPMSGTIVELLANEEDTVTVGQDLFRIEAGTAADSAQPKEQPPSSHVAPPEPPRSQQPEKTTEPSPPLQEAKETSKPTVKKETPPNQDKPPALSSVSGKRTETRVKMSRMRQRIAERLKESQTVAASLTTFNEIDMSELMALRARHKHAVMETQGVKLGFMSAFAHACVLALREIPAVNGAIDGDEIVYHDYVDLSVAVATPKGLVTPVVRNVESMSLLEIEKEIAALGKKARDGKLSLEDMSGGTFTISNGGVFGSLFGTPIINLPQSAVLGMHAIKDRPVVVDGEIVVRPIMTVALTYDHRLLDGRDAVTFLVKVKDYIEDPGKMLLA